VEFQMWWVWAGFAAVCIIGEIFTAGFFILWFGLGAIAAAVLSFFGFSPVWQLGVFALVSGFLLALSRKFANKISSPQPAGIGSDRFLGKKGIVLEDIDNINNTGKIRIEKEEWRAESESGEVIFKDALVEVIKVEGTHLIVKVFVEDVPGPVPETESKVDFEEKDGEA